MNKQFYNRTDNTYHYISELPQTLRKFVDYQFSSGGIAGDDFNSFNIKFKNAIKKLLPEEYKIYSWNKGHYYCSAVIQTPNDKFIFISISDVRYCMNDWIDNILIRSMANPTDWCGGPNKKTSLLTFSYDVTNVF